MFRDLDLLRQAGVPLLFNEAQQAYRIVGGFMLPPTSFTPQEALSLLVLCHEMGQQSALPFFAPAQSAAMKVESCLPARLREYIREVTAAVRIRPDVRATTDHDKTFQALVEAVRTRHCVRINYGSLNDGKYPGEKKPVITKLSPYQLLFSRRSWYVIGRSSVHRAVRTFNVHRINEFTVLEDTFQRPRDFQIEQVLRNAWHLIAEPGPDRHVVVRFDRQVAQNVAEVAWHRTQRVEMNPDGSCDFHVDVSGLNEISWWILGYGDRATVLEPIELQQIVGQHAENMARRYRCIDSVCAPK